MYRTVVTVCTGQWSQYVPHNGHYMHRILVTICTAQWSLYVRHSGHYICRRVVTLCTKLWSLYVLHSGYHVYGTMVIICTAYWLLYVPHSGHYMYCIVFNICAAEWSYYVPHSGQYMYRTAVTICTAQWSLYLPPRYKSYVLPTHWIYVFCADPRTNSDYFSIQHKLTGFYNKDGVCSLRGTDCIFSYNSGESEVLKWVDTHFCLFSISRATHQSGALLKAYTLPVVSRYSDAE